MQALNAPVLAESTSTLWCSERWQLIIGHRVSGGAVECVEIGVRGRCRPDRRCPSLPAGVERRESGWEATDGWSRQVAGSQVVRPVDVLACAVDPDHSV